MATMNIGTISASLAFAERTSPDEIEIELRPYLFPDEAGEPTLLACLTDAFAAQCDVALQSLIRAHRRRLPTLRVEVSYGGPDYQRRWLYLGAELMVDKEAVDDAQEFLEEVADAFDQRLTVATERFRADQFALRCLAGAKASFYLHEKPIWDS